MRKLEDVLAEQARPDPRDLRSRSDDKRERRAREDRLAALSKRLVGLAEKRLDRLELPEPVLDAVLDAKAISSPIALGRQLRVVRRTLREADADAIEERLERLVAPDGSGARRAKVAEAWADRLVSDGDAALTELLSRFPGGDRTRIRQALRAVSGHEATGAKRKKLVAAVGDAIASTDHPGDDDPSP